MYCRLCKTPAEPFFEGRHGDYFNCPRCLGVFLAPADHLDPAEERARYETHNNDVHDERYQKFVDPIVSAVKADYSTSKKGLDFGSGTGPVISHLLRQEGYSIDQYDPYFENDTSIFRNRYDFIVCCEVIEHFRHPAREFAKLNQLLEPAGTLICMTELLLPETKFEDWYYKDDPTHIFFYRPETVAYVAEAFEFVEHSINGRLVKWVKKSGA